MYLHLLSCGPRLKSQALHQGIFFHIILFVFESWTIMVSPISANIYPTMFCVHFFLMSVPECSHYFPPTSHIYFTLYLFFCYLFLTLMCCPTNEAALGKNFSAERIFLLRMSEIVTGRCYDVGNIKVVSPLVDIKTGRKDPLKKSVVRIISLSKVPYL